MKTQAKQRECLFCLDPLPLDSHPLQKFCKRVVRADGSIKCCKDRFHNHNRRPEYHLTKGVNKKYLKYDSILERLYYERKRNLSFQTLVDNGLDLNFLHSKKNADTGSICYICLQYMLVRVSNNDYKLSKIQDHEV